jgi:hypothetical protein
LALIVGKETSIKRTLYACQLVIDCQKLVDTGLLPKNDDLIYDIETASKVLCHAIHTKRLNFNCAE